MADDKKKIHIDLTERIHKQLRIKAAINDLSMQKFVERLIADAVADIQLDDFEVGRQSIAPSQRSSGAYGKARRRSQKSN